MDKLDYNEIFRDRTKKLAIDIIIELSKLKYTDENSILKKQIIRSATSVAANYRAMCRARSNRERYAKMSIVVEEIDETDFWLELLEELKILPIAKVNEFKKEADEILKATSSYKKQLSKSL
jgi:four helix bundle protein